MENNTRNLETKILVLDPTRLIEDELIRGGLKKSQMILAEDYQQALTLVEYYYFVAAVIEPKITPTSIDYKENVPMTCGELANASLEEYDEYQNKVSMFRETFEQNQRTCHKNVAQLLKKHNPEIEIYCVCAFGPEMNDPIYGDVRVVPMKVWGPKETNPICQVGESLKDKYFKKKASPFGFIYKLFCF